MNTLSKRFLAFMAIGGVAAVPLVLQADDDGLNFFRPTVVVSVTATGNGPLHYRWRSSDGAIRDIDAPTTHWTLPSGPGLHFAYVLVSDGKGGHTESRVAVNTDLLGTTPEARASEPRQLRAPAAAARAGDTYRGIMSFSYLPGCDGQCDVYAAGGQVYLTDALGIRHPSTGTVTTDSLGFFTIPNVPAGNVTVFCNPDFSPTLIDCGYDTMDSIAYTDYSTGLFGANLSYITGSVFMADGNPCNFDDELFGVHRAATATVLDGGANALATVRVDGFGNYAVPPTSANAAAVRFTCEGAPAFTQAVSANNYYPGGQFVGTGNPSITAMTAPLNGNPGLFNPEALCEPGCYLPQDSSIYTGRTNNFLAFKGIDSRKAACQYYKAIGAVTGCGPGGQLEGAISYYDWQRSVHIGPYAREGGVRAHATYVNKVDLNLTRVHDSVRYGTSSLATVVCNHLGPAIQDSTQVLNTPTAAVDAAVSNAIAGKNLVACVAMDYQLNPGVNGNQKFVRFYIFGPSGQLLPSVNLDGRGEKFMPGSCVSCHGGEHYAGRFPEDGSGSADFGGHMLPYDEGNFEFSNADGLTDSQREEAIYRLNQNLLAVDPPVTPQTEGALTVVAQNLIRGWYSNTSLPAHQLDQNYVPAAWQSFDQSNNYYYSDPTNLTYRRVIARACRTCHVNQEDYNFEDPTAYVVNNPQEMSRSTCGGVDGGNGNGGYLSDDLSRVTTMPNSVVTFDRYWLSQGTTDPVSGESTDMPQILANFLGDGDCGNPPFIHY